MKYKPYPKADSIGEEAINELFMGATDVASATPYKVDCDIGRRVRVWCEQIIPDHIQTIRTTQDNGVIEQIGKLCMKQYATLRRKNTVPNRQMQLFFAMVDLRHAIYIRSTGDEVNNNE